MRLNRLSINSPQKIFLLILIGLAGCSLVLSRALFTNQTLPEWRHPSSTQNTLRLSQGSLIALPELNQQPYSLLYQSKYWRVYKSFPLGYIDIQFLGKTRGLQADAYGFSRLRANVYPLGFLSDNSNLYIIGYDVVKNIPQGRSLAAIQPGLDVYSIGINNISEPKLVAGNIDLGAGLDSVVYSQLKDGEITLCAENKCADLKTGTNSDVRYWRNNQLEGYEFIEVAIASGKAYAIARRQWDDRVQQDLNRSLSQYSFVTMDSRGAIVTPIRKEGIPYRLSLIAGRPTISLATTAADFRDLIIYEVARMPNLGLMSYGDNNLEGRIAWNQVYYLNAFISIASGELGFTDKILEMDAKARVKEEVGLVAKLGLTPYPGYYSKRYSLEREPILFALHLGRIGYLLKRAESIGVTSSDIIQAQSYILQELRSLNSTVEQYESCHYEKIPQCLTLKYKKNYPFWADGVNVPYNYISGYVLGLLSLSNASHDVLIAESLMRPLILIESFSESPRLWRYWWGLGHEGWSFANSPSANTQRWSGNKVGHGLAHISYRTMDAMALLMLAYKTKDTKLLKLVDYLPALIKLGAILPFAEELAPSQRTKLSLLTAKRFARSVRPQDLQSQVWALASLYRSVK